LPTNTQSTFELSPGRCWITLHSKVKVIDCMHQITKTYLEREHSILLSVITRTRYVYQVCHGVGRCVKDESCSSSSMEWKSMDCINGISYYLNKCQTLSNTSQMTFFSFRKTAHWCACIVRATQSNCCGSLEFLSPEPCPPTAPSWTRWLQDVGSHTAASVWVMSQKDWRHGVTSWILVMHWYSIWVKNAIFVFSCFARYSAEAQVIWGGTLKRPLIAYFISNISAKKISKCVHINYVKLTAN